MTNCASYLLLLQALPIAYIFVGTWEEPRNKTTGYFLLNIALTNKFRSREGQESPPAFQEEGSHISTKFVEIWSYVLSECFYEHSCVQPESLHSIRKPSYVAKLSCWSWQLLWTIWSRTKIPVIVHACVSCSLKQIVMATFWSWEAWCFLL